MGKIPQPLREKIAKNIRECRMKKFPGRGGAKKCAETFGVSPQQWSPWERGSRTPDESRLGQIAEFFNVSVEYLRRDNRLVPGAPTISPLPHSPDNDIAEQTTPAAVAIPHSLSTPETIMTLHSMRLKAVYEVEVSVKSVKYVPQNE